MSELIHIKIEMENGGTIRAELYPEIAPVTVENFVKLVESTKFNLPKALQD